MTEAELVHLDRPDRYPAALRRLHWLMAVLLMIMVVLGLYMSALPRGNTLKALLLNGHLMLGSIILLLALLRLHLRFRSSLPPKPGAYSNARRHLIAAVHGGFYVLMIGLPILGLSVWAIDPFVGGPALLGEGVWISNLAGVLYRMHYLGAWLLCGLLMVHILGALGTRAGGRWTLRRML